jgi:hypothetical protein
VRRWRGCGARGCVLLSPHLQRNEAPHCRWPHAACAGSDATHAAAALRQPARQLLKLLLLLLLLLLVVGGLVC